ncbi:large ribosomal subunit protein uL4m [Phaenicophaeus curvirostris]|uniref:large ribosomal subunit protein uL4m n=1 Tax=Phaenicophaeus curvirostris TaxID=33595 RepID=UPI0037F0EAE0
MIRAAEPRGVLAAAAAFKALTGGWGRAGAARVRSQPRPPGLLGPLSPTRSRPRCWILSRCPRAPELPASPSPPTPAAPAQAWLESLRGPQLERRGLADLHPDVFAVPPRLDILHTVATWQRNYKRISYAKVKTRAEVRGGGRKPWRQKGSGRARHGSIRSPLWRGGGVAHGPRGPTSYFYMLPMKIRVLGLKVALTVKLMQDDLHVVDNLEVPTSDPQYLLDLVRYRRWGSSVLIVDVNEAPENIARATAALKTINLIPAVGLNVYSMLKHETLVLTLDAVAFLEEKLLWHDTRYSALYPFAFPYRDTP